MKRSLFTLIIMLAIFCASYAQTPVMYEAKVYTPTGIKTGLLERVYNHGIGIMVNDDVLFIDALNIKEVKVKRYSGSFGSKVLGTALLGSMMALNTAANNDEDKLNNPANYNSPYSATTLSESAGYALAGATISSVVGAIPGIRKSKKFSINQDKSVYNNLRTDIAQYGRYNQLVPFSITSQ
jgi:hypothetical protein